MEICNGYGQNIGEVSVENVIPWDKPDTTVTCVVVQLGPVTMGMDAHAARELSAALLVAATLVDVGAGGHDHRH